MAKKIKPKKTREERDAERQAAEAERERQEAGIQDEFQAKGFELVEWMQEKRHVVLGLIAAIVVAGGALSAYALMQAGANEAASKVYAEALKAYEGGIGDPLPGENSDGPRFKDAKERAQKARELFEKVVSEHRSTDVSTLASLYVGHTSLQLGEADKAVEAYQRFLDRTDKKDPLRFAGLDGLASALEAKGDVDGAIQRLQEIVDLPGTVAEDAALFRIGRLYLDKGDKAKAKEVLERLTKDHPDSTLKVSADELLAKAQ